VVFLSARDYSVRVSGKHYKLRVEGKPDGSFHALIGGRMHSVRVIEGSKGDGMVLIVNGHKYEVKIKEIGPQVFEVEVEGKPFRVELEPLLKSSSWEANKIRRELTQPGIRRPRSVIKPVGGAILSPMPGKVISLKVRVGDEVRKGDVLLIIEAMKMENEIRAPRDGVVREIMVSEGSSVSTGQPLLVLD